MPTETEIKYEKIETGWSRVIDPKVDGPMGEEIDGEWDRFSRLDDIGNAICKIVGALTIAAMIIIMLASMIIDIAG